MFVSMDVIALRVWEYVIAFWKSRNSSLVNSPCEEMGVSFSNESGSSFLGFSTVGWIATMLGFGLNDIHSFCCSWNMTGARREQGSSSACCVIMRFMGVRKTLSFL